MNKQFLFYIPEYSVDTKMGGIGVRTLDIAVAVAEFHKVQIICKNKSDINIPKIDILGQNEVDSNKLIKDCDVIFFFDLGQLEVMQIAVNYGKFIVVENSVPIEHLEFNPSLNPLSREQAYKTYLENFKAQIILADHFIVRSKVERVTLISTLAIMGRLTPKSIQQSRTLNHLITLVNIGFSEYSDDALNIKGRNLSSYNQLDNKKTLLWTGGLWDFMSPEKILKLFLKKNKLSLDLNLGFLYTPPSDQILKSEELFKNLNKYSNVWIAEPSPNHFQRGEWIKSADALICLAKPGIENETCVRLRLRDTFLYYKPIIVDPYGATADYVNETGIGVVCKSLNHKDIRNAVEQVVYDTYYRKSCIKAIIREREKVSLHTSIVPFLEKGTMINWKPRGTAKQKIAELNKYLKSNKQNKFISPY